MDISQYFVTRLVEIFEHQSPGITTKSVHLSFQPSIPGMSHSSYRKDGLAFLILSKEGVIPADADIIREAGIKSILIDAVNLSAGHGAFKSPTIAAWAEFYIAAEGVTNTKVSRSDFLRESVGGVSYQGKPTGYFSSLEVIGRRILVRKSDIAELVKPGNVSRAQWNKVSQEADLDKWGLWSSGVTPELNLNLVDVCAELDLHGGFGITLLYFKNDGKSDADPIWQPSPFAATWNRIVHSPVLKQSLR